MLPKAMLERWVSKGKVERRKVEADCGTSCNSAVMERYIWRG
jgi:hypothetical protein